ncbi:HAUS augmin-like complex subunit 6 [Tubulanus polymorphus]|uniref:HAUS augmin-like complex subunit 6 n=1 Tax=Tubulanus polymorphus TaxID=672921 RepID=UPI003DA26723
MDLSEVANTRKIFFTNLLLLGFNPEINEAQTRIHFHQDMFKVPNRAAFEIVIKYLLDKLDPIRSNQEFRDCWPIGDKKREMEFRKVCVAWLTQIASEPDSNLPTIAQSLFLSPGGQRCDQLLANFSRYVLKIVMKKELGTE